MDSFILVPRNSFTPHAVCLSVVFSVLASDIVSNSVAVGVALKREVDGRMVTDGTVLAAGAELLHVSDS